MATLEAQEVYSRRQEPECVKDDQACSGEMLSVLRVLRLLRWVDWAEGEPRVSRGWLAPEQEQQAYWLYAELKTEKIDSWYLNILGLPTEPDRE